MKRPSWRDALETAYPLVAVGLVFLLWALVVWGFKLPQFLLPSPSSILGEIYAKKAHLGYHALFTLAGTLAGFLLSVAVGVPCAIALTASRVLERGLTPVLVFSQTVPKIAIAPLLIIWFGFGLVPKVIVSFMIAFFPIVIATTTGLKAAETDMLDLIRSMGASERQVFTKVRLPFALPYFFSGAKVSVALAVVGAIVGEFIGSDKGLGHVLVTAQSYLDTRLAFASLIVLAAIGVVLFFVVNSLERLCLPWHVTQRLDETIIETA